MSLYCSSYSCKVLNAERTDPFLTLKLRCSLLAIKVKCCWDLLDIQIFKSVHIQTLGASGPMHHMLLLLSDCPEPSLWQEALGHKKLWGRAGCTNHLLEKLWFSQYSQERFEKTHWIYTEVNEHFTALNLSKGINLVLTPSEAPTFRAVQMKLMSEASKK